MGGGICEGLSPDTGTCLEINAPSSTGVHGWGVCYVNRQLIAHEGDGVELMLAWGGTGGSSSEMAISGGCCWDPFLLFPPDLDGSSSLLYRLQWIPPGPVVFTSLPCRRVSRHSS